MVFCLGLVSYELLVCGVCYRLRDVCLLRVCFGLVLLYGFNAMFLMIVCLFAVLWFDLWMFGVWVELLVLLGVVAARFSCAC